MTLTEQQIEWIVQEVVRRLRTSHADVLDAKVSPSESPQALQISERLVTTETLRNRLQGITTVEVARRTIVTPAVVDLLKDRKIQLVRT